MLANLSKVLSSYTLLFQNAHFWVSCGVRLIFTLLLLNPLTAGCADTEKVQEAITSQNIQDPSPRAGLLDDIALSLDGRSRVLGNWFNLAMKLDVPREACWRFGTRSTQNPTNQLFQYLETQRPRMTLKEFKEALQSMTRNDLLQIIATHNMEGKSLISPVSDLLFLWYEL